MCDEARDINRAKMPWQSTFVRIWNWLALLIVCHFSLIQGTCLLLLVFYYGTCFMSAKYVSTQAVVTDSLKKADWCLLTRLAVMVVLTLPLLHGR